MYEPKLREWPVDGRMFESKSQVRPVGGQTLRERPVDALVYKPIPRERPVGESHMDRGQGKDRSISQN